MKSVEQQAAELARALRDTGEELTGALATGMTAAGQFVVGEAKKNIQRNRSIDTGLLIGSVSSKSRRVPEGIQTDVGTIVEYAAFVELGTVRNRPKPYLEPAVNNNKQVIEKIIADHLEQKL